MSSEDLVGKSATRRRLRQLMRACIITGSPELLDMSYQESLLDSVLASTRTTAMSHEECSRLLVRATDLVDQLQQRARTLQEVQPTGPFAFLPTTSIVRLMTVRLLARDASQVRGLLRR